MTAVFQTVLNMSITGAYIAAAIIVLRLVMKKLPKRFSYALWIILGIRLLCPFSFSSAASLFNLVKPETAENTVTTQMTYIPQNIEHAPKPQVTVAPPILDDAVNEAITESLPPPTPENSADPMQVVLFAAAIVWLAGVAVMAAYTVISYFSVRKKLAGATLLRDNIYTCGNIGTPFVYGTVRPKIYLPEDIPEADTDYILAHERTHIRRGDHIVKLIAMAALCLHWFNPLVWVSYKLMTKDMELSCDERAVSRFDRDVRKDYANALLNISARQNHISLGGILAFGESNIKSRIKGVLAAKKPTVIVTAVSVIAVAAAAVCLLTNAKNSAEDNPREMHTTHITFPFNSTGMAVWTTSSDKPFDVRFLMPAGWRYAAPAGDVKAYWEGFSSPRNILDENDQIVGTVAFSRIEIGYNGDEDYRSTVYEQIVLDYFKSWYGDYKSVRSDQDGGSGVASVTSKDPETGTETRYHAALGYNTNISVYVGIRFKEGAVTDEELEMIAESIYFNKKTLYTDEIEMFSNYLETHYTWAFMRTSENMLPPSAYTDNRDLISYMDLRLKRDTTLYDGLYLKNIVIKDGEIERGEMADGHEWVSLPYEITYTFPDHSNEQVISETAYFEYYKTHGAVRISSCWLGSSGDRLALGEPDGEPPYEFDFKAGTAKLTERLFEDYLYSYYNAVFNGGVNYESFDIGKYTDRDDLKNYLRLKLIYDLDAYERYDLISIEVGDSHTDGSTLLSGVKPDGTKWMTVPCEITYKDTWDGSESSWGRSAYFEYNDDNGFVRMTAVADGSTGAHYSVETLSQSLPYDIDLKDGTEKLLNSPAVRRLASSDFETSDTGSLPTYLKEVCEPYIIDYWNYFLKLGDFEPTDYISDPDMLYYANSVKYHNAGYISHGIRELNGVILRLENFGSISETRDWAYFKYDLGIIVDDISDFNENAFKDYTAYFEIDKTDGGYEIYRAYTNFDLGDFGLPNEPLSFPLPNFDLKAAVRNNLRMDSFVITEPILHYDGMGGLSSTGQDDGDVTVRFSMPQNWSADNGIVYPLKDYNTGNIKIIEFGPAYPASETIPRVDFLTDYAYGDEITLLDEEHYEGDNLLYTDFYHTWKYSSEMQRELEQYIYTVDRGGYSINVYAYPDDLFMTRWICEEILKTLTIEKAGTQRQTETPAVSAASPEELRESLQALEASLKSESLSNSITYGVIDIDRDGSDEFFAVLSKGDQGYNEVRFYSADLTPLLLTDGFSRDGSTYFMYDGTNSCMLMFSDYTHSYFLKNEKVFALYGDGSMAEFFEAVWTADSPREDLKRTETYVNSSKASESDYDSAYSEFMGGQLSDIYYIYDGKLYLGSEQVRSSGDVFDNYYQSRNAA
ncbi:MAG: M56 family metallopeptidase [Oscillospiraceae bacterium]|nr:M56 family metallopeptidase [Oscillospiraceae bacterium]